ncbi:pilus assembly protein [Paraferrimonas haliotis]|uniref:Type IV pili system adhesin PilY n=1 Tax=Paraferrimonas haliotis TaxID=2013866 RepID=A0AA37TQ59_9GAMM|nr:PilC/PilY family type IV pilus protein [Paraferrimonas haliotis]GLS82561.1 type IV pili system adhesin PilY [Paraferrimonas haliotis]
MVRILITILTLTFVILSQVKADDTELYVFDASQRKGVRPKVLIIFDNSGSMNAVSSEKPGYDPTIDYDPVLSGFFGDKGLYWTANGIDNASMPVPSSPSDARRFLEAINGCDTARQALDKHGIYTGFIREYSKKGNTGSWEEIRENNGFNANDLIDCLADINEGNPKNAPGQADAFPIDGGKPKGNDHFDAAYDTNIADYVNNTNFGSGSPITLYTDNYLFWFHADEDDLGTVSSTLLEQAQKVITSVIETTPGIDLGLSLFNLNYPSGTRHGGRIVAGIQEMNAAGRADLASKVSRITADTNTPLTETLYEAYRYLSGKSPYYGFADSSYKGGSVDYDTKSKSYLPTDPNCLNSDGNYISPFGNCQGSTYIILITDGLPTEDENADSKIKSLPQGVGKPYVEGKMTSYLPALAEWMYKHDVVSPASNYDDVDMKRNTILYTIGFSDQADDAEGLLLDAAKRGGGKYFSAYNSQELQKSLTDIFIEISKETASFTSPSIASNNFDRTQTLDAVYYGMFYPNSGPRWMGNLKKLRIKGDGTIVDSRGLAAIGLDGNIRSRSCSIWTPTSTCSALADGGDGNEVHDGGVVHMLRQGSKRSIYSDTGVNGSLQTLSASNLAAKAGDMRAAVDYLNLSSSDSQSDSQIVAEQIAWIEGKDVDNDLGIGNSNAIRQDVLGDPLHSKPLAITFGKSDGSQDVRILMGTNHGLLHMFKDAGDTVSEAWAFAPYDLLPNSVTLRDNPPSGIHSEYGVDSSPVAYVRDVNANGMIEPSDGDKVWVYFGLRRGGNAYYAMDITNPDSPKLLWKVDADTTGLSELGQSWSEPIVTYINGYPGTSKDTAKPVVVIGGGYDSLKDKAGPTYKDSAGRAVYILDAETGTPIHSFGATGSGASTIITDMVDSIPNKIAALDSNGDGLSDRLYATDTGANVWRFDLVGTDFSKWTAYKFAELGGSSDVDNRRFFSEPAVAQTAMTQVTSINGDMMYQEQAYDAITVGSGNRPGPLGLDREDYFFTLRDRNVYSALVDLANPAPAPIRMSDMYDVMKSGYGSASDQAGQDALDETYSAKKGWFMHFSDEGEKALSAATILGGKVYYTSFVPQTELAENQCMLEGGGRLYVRDLHRGINSLSEPYYDLGVRVPDTPQIVVPPGEPSDIYLVGVGKGELNPDGEYSGSVGTDMQMRAKRIYYHIDE